MNENQNITILLSLKGYDSFKEVFNTGKKVYRNEAMLVYNKKTSADLKVYFGVSISKRNAKKAVVRNRIKRLIRVSIIDYHKEVESNLPYDNFVIIWRKAPQMQSLINLNDVKPIVFEMLNESIKKINQ